MPLTVSIGMTNITTAETTTGWTAIGSQSPALEPDFFVQGSNCISRAVSNTTKGMVFDYGSAIDFTSGVDQDKLVYIWMRVNTPQLVDLQANGGVVVRLGTTTSAYREWYVDGSDTIPATDGWICYVIDPQSAGSSTTGAYNANSVQFFGGAITTTTTAKGQNLGIDRISFGRGEIQVSGTNTVAGEGFQEISDADWGDVSLGKWGIVTEKDGIFYVKGKIVLGHATNTTVFSSRGEKVVFQSPSYYNGTTTVKCIPDASVNGVTGLDGKTSYNGLAFLGGTSVSIDLGVIVGTDGGRSGVTMSCAENKLLTVAGRTLATITADSAAMSLNIYGCTFEGFEGQVDLTGTGIAASDCFSTTFNGCGRIDSNMTIRNFNVLNSVAVATDGALIWGADTDISDGVFANNSRAIVFESSSGTPFSFTNIIFGNNTFDVRNEATDGNITIALSGGTSPNVEDVATSVTTVSSSVTLTFNVSDEAGNPVSGALAYIDDNDTAPYIMNTTTNASGVASVGHTAGSVIGARWRVRKYGYKPFKAIIDIPASGTKDVPVTLIADPQQI